MSPKIDWEEYNESATQQESLPAGIYHVKVVSSEEKTSAKGNAYFNIRLEDLESGKTACFDTIMISGKGVRIGLAKLSKLGFKPGDDDEIVAAQLIGKIAFVSLKEDTYGGNTRLTVDISAKTSSCGYWSEDNPPAESDGSDLDKAPF
tara:strand:- start:1921 stop:2364 length:444 start_codon:yes stop_codon:yes gene_type:complete